MSYTEENWIRYAELFQDQWDATELQLELLETCNGNVELARVIHFHLADNCIDWMHRKIPALDDMKPVDCLETEDLLKKLKGCLMRFH